MKFFIVDRKLRIFIRDDEDNEVSFDSPEELIFYTNTSLPYTGEVVYEPPVYFMHGKEQVEFSPSELAFYEDAIAKVKLYSSRKKDPYHGSSVQKALKLKIDEIMTRAEQEDAKPIKHQNQLWKPSTAVLNTLIYAMLLGTSDEAPLPTNKGKWDNIDGTLSKSMKLKDLKALFKEGYETNAANYENMKVHIDAVSKLSTVEDIRAYDYSAGWR